MMPLASGLYFSLPEQKEIFRGRMIETDRGSKVLLNGIKQTAIFSQNGCNIQCDSVVNWFDKEKVRHHKPRNVLL
jgi:hypothetical protein